MNETPNIQREKVSQIANYNGQFCCSGYDASIDYLKGVSILWVLMTHCIPYPIQDATSFVLWGAQAVPIFLVIQVFHAYKKGFDSVTISFEKLWKRIIKPFLITSVIIYVMYVGFGYISHISVGEQTIKFLKSGGVGAGSYYFWVYLQFALLLPLIATVLKKFNTWTSLIVLAIIAELFEIICCSLQIPEWLYRLLFFRYFFLIFIGYYLVKHKVKLNLPMIVIAVLSAMALLLFQYGDVNFEPFFFKSDWKSQHWITYGYELFIIFILAELFKKTSNSSFSRLMLLCGKYSYEIFLWQMIYFCLPLQSFFEKVLGDIVSTVIYIIMSLLVCIIPVLYVKSKKELLLLWNSKE